jgi:hypothetical protein
VRAGTGGAKKGAGAWAERRGRGSQQRARVPLVNGGRGEGGADREGPRRREREGVRGATTQRLAERAREAQREEGRRGKSNWRRQVGPTGQREGGGSVRGRNRR